MDRCMTPDTASSRSCAAEARRRGRPFNFTPVPRYNYLVGVDRPGDWTEIANSDAQEYGGSGMGNRGRATALAVPAHGRSHSLSLTLPPLGGVFFKPPPEVEPPLAALREEVDAEVEIEPAVDETLARRDSMERYVCIHGTSTSRLGETVVEAIEGQPSAYPYHDWNEAGSRPNATRQSLPRILRARKPDRFRSSTLRLDELQLRAEPRAGSWLAQKSLRSTAPFPRRCRQPRAVLGDARRWPNRTTTTDPCRSPTLADRHTQVLWGIRDFSPNRSGATGGIWRPRRPSDTQSLETLAALGIASPSSRRTRPATCGLSERPTGNATVRETGQSTAVASALAFAVGAVRSRVLLRRPVSRASLSSRLLVPRRPARRAG